MLIFWNIWHAVVIKNKEDDVAKIGMRDTPMVVNHEASICENLLGMIVHSKDEAFKLYNNYTTQTGFVIGKINLDM